MITANTQKMIEAALEIDRQADVVEREGLRLEQALRAQRAQRKLLLFFAAPTADIDEFARQRAAVTEGLRNQSLYLRECAKRYKTVQSLATARKDQIDREQP